jgi:hypothetical protein
MSNEQSASIWRDFRRRDPAGANPAPGVGPPVQSDEAEEAEEAEEAKEADVLIYQSPTEGTFLLRSCWFKVI